MPSIREDSVAAAVRSLCAAVVITGALSQARPVSVPQTFDWQPASPHSQSMSMAALDGLKDRLAAATTKAFLVVRNDRLIYEWYSPDHSATTKHYTASMAKAIVGGLATAVVLTDRRIALDDKVSAYVPRDAFLGIGRRSSGGPGDSVVEPDCGPQRWFARRERGASRHVACDDLRAAGRRDRIREGTGGSVRCGQPGHPRAGMGAIREDPARRPRQRQLAVDVGR
jgi:hypothetical protein